MPKVTIKNSGKAAYVIPVDGDEKSSVTIAPGASESVPVSDYVLGILKATETLNVSGAKDPLDHDGDGEKGGFVQEVNTSAEPVKETAKTEHVEQPRPRGRPRKDA